jgi:hypothetical protein
MFWKNEWPKILPDKHNGRKLTRTYYTSSSLTIMRIPRLFPDFPYDRHPLTSPATRPRDGLQCVMQIKITIEEQSTECITFKPPQHEQETDEKYFSNLKIVRPR